MRVPSEPIVVNINPLHEEPIRKLAPATAMNPSNIQRLANMYAAFQNYNGGHGPSASGCRSRRREICTATIEGLDAQSAFAAASCRRYWTGRAFELSFRSPLLQLLLNFIEHRLDAIEPSLDIAGGAAFARS